MRANEQTPLTVQDIRDYEAARMELASMLGHINTDQQPLAIFHTGEKRYEDRHSLMWFIGRRVVCENFYPTQGADGKSWSRHIYDYEPESNRLVSHFSSDKASPQSMHVRHLFNDTVDNQSRPSIHLRHITAVIQDLVHDPAHTELQDFSWRNTTIEQ